MHGELAQLVALTTHGTAFLRQGGPPPELFPDHSTFRFVGDVTFVRPRGPFGLLRPRGSLSSGTAAWLQLLRKGGVTHLELMRSRGAAHNRELPPHIEVGFSNGLDAALVARNGRGSAEIWTGHWRVAEPNHPRQRIWAVSYRGVSTRGLRPYQVSLNDAAERLAEALDAAREVALDNSWDTWAERLRLASAELSSPSPTIKYHADMLPPRGYGLRARQVLAGVSAGWVLGGMGSWNDLAPRDEKPYAAVTVQLHAALVEGAAAAASSFDHVA